MSIETVDVLMTDNVNGQPIQGAQVISVITPLDSNHNPLPTLTDTNGKVSYPVIPLNRLGVTINISADGYESYTGLYRNLGPGATIRIGLNKAAPPVVIPPTPVNIPTFDHDWTGKVELALRALFVAGTIGQDAIDIMNAKGGIYSGGEFQPHHDGVGFPTYGFGWFYISDLSNGVGTANYQIVEFGVPPIGN